VTTAFHCDNLCSCDTCAPTRWALSYVEGFRKPLGSYAAVCHRESAAYLAAWSASRDPAKLAELMAMGGESRGMVVLIFPLAARATTAPILRDKATLVFYDVDAIHIYPSLSLTPRILTLGQVRADLLAIMSTPANETSRNECERIIRGESC